MSLPVAHLPCPWEHCILLIVSTALLLSAHLNATPAGLLIVATSFILPFGGYRVSHGLLLASSSPFSLLSLSNARIIGGCAICSINLAFDSIASTLSSLSYDWQFCNKNPAWVTDHRRQLLLSCSRVMVCPGSFSIALVNRVLCRSPWYISLIGTYFIFMPHTQWLWLSTSLSIWTLTFSNFPASCWHCLLGSLQGIKFYVSGRMFLYFKTLLYPALHSVPLSWLFGSWGTGLASSNPFDCVQRCLVYILFPYSSALPRLGHVMTWFLILA